MPGEANLKFWGHTYVGLNDKIEQETQNLDLNRVINIFSGSILACEKF